MFLLLSQNVHSELAAIAYTAATLYLLVLCAVLSGLQHYEANATHAFCECFCCCRKTYIQNWLQLHTQQLLCTFLSCAQSYPVCNTMKPTRPMHFVNVFVAVAKRTFRIGCNCIHS